MDPEFEKSINRRLVERDPVAPAELIEACIELLVNRLRRAFNNINDPHLVDEAVEDALLNYIQFPEKYSPSRGRLTSYLLMSARGDLLNKLESESRRQTHETRLEDVELRLSLRNILVEEDEPVHDLDIYQEYSMDDINLKVQQIIPDDIDKKVVELILENERKTESYAKILGISDLDIKEQRRQVKRVKDRLLKRLQRLGIKLHG
jgi:RNA polymerase sigma-70 factor (ECF subfamily)